MADLPARLDAVLSTIERIMAIGETPGAFIGITRKGKQIYYAGLGFRDVERELPVTERHYFPCLLIYKGCYCSRDGSSGR